MIAFLQALGLISYCSLIAVVFWRAETWFGRVPNFFAPLLMLSLFTTSALICGLIVFAYPVKLYLTSKRLDVSLKLVLKTAVWLIIFSLAIMLAIAFKY